MEKLTGQYIMAQSINDCIETKDANLLLELVRDWWKERAHMTFEERELLVRAWLGVLPKLRQSK